MSTPLCGNAALRDRRLIDLPDPTEELNVIAISDNDPTRSPSPSSGLPLKPTPDGPEGHTAIANSKNQISTPSARAPQPMSRSESNPQRLILKTRIENFHHSSSPIPPGSGQQTFHTNTSHGSGSRRQRPETSHQKAVNINRKLRINHILHQKVKQTHRIAREQRSRHRSSFGLMVMNRVKGLPDIYDSDEENAWGLGGLLPNRNEADDFGEEALSYKKAIDRAVRRLHRQENSMSSGTANKHHQEKKRMPRDNKNNGISKRRPKDRSSRGAGFSGNHRRVQREETLDDLDLALLGEGQDEDDEMDYDSGMDDTEDADLTEDEVMNEA